jgi:hypothetical protein
MAKSYAALLLFATLGCASLDSEFTSASNAEAYLATADTLESPYVGDGGSKSRGFDAFAVISRSPRARDHFLALVTNGSPVGKLYGLIGMYRADPHVYSDLERAVMEEHGAARVKVLITCIGSEPTVAEVITGSAKSAPLIRDGSWSRMLFPQQPGARSGV